jgi:hypothetical protein
VLRLWLKTDHIHFFVNKWIKIKNNKSSASIKSEN